MERGWMLEGDERIADADLRLPCPLRAPVEDWIDTWWENAGRPEISVRAEGHATRHGRPDVHPDPPVLLYPGVSPLRLAAWKSEVDLPDWPQSPNHPLAKLRDPLHQVAVLCVNPLILVADEKRLGRPAPASWQELRSPEFEGTLAMRGTGNSVCETTLLAWDHRFGTDAIGDFRRAVAFADHPAKIVNAMQDRREGSPKVAVLPLFFARILSRHEGIKLVWPSEGAVASPVCLRVEKNATESAKALAMHLFGTEFAAVTDGLGMPSCHPDSAGVPEGNTFLWPGWERMRDPRLDEQEQGLQERFGGNSIPGL